MYKRASKPQFKKLRRRKIVRRNKFRRTYRKPNTLPLRRCSFCRTEHLSSGTVAFLGITACPVCLRDETTDDFRALLGVYDGSYQQQFTGGGAI